MASFPCCRLLVKNDVWYSLDFEQNNRVVRPSGTSYRRRSRDPCGRASIETRHGRSTSRSALFTRRRREKRCKICRESKSRPWRDLLFIYYRCPNGGRVVIEITSTLIFFASINRNSHFFKSNFSSIPGFHREHGG